MLDTNNIRPEIEELQRFQKSNEDEEDEEGIGLDGVGAENKTLTEQIRAQALQVSKPRTSTVAHDCEMATVECYEPTHPPTHPPHQLYRASLRVL